MRLWTTKSRDQKNNLGVSAMMVLHGENTRDLFAWYQQ
jgi:hypothetical protein